MYREHAQQTLSSVADLKVNSLLEWRFERVQDADFIKKQLDLSKLSNSVIKNLYSKEFREEVIDHITQMQSINQYEVIILDVSGNQQFTFPGDVPPISKNPKAFVAESVSTKKIIAVDLYRSEINNKIYMGYLIPLLDKNNQNKVYGVAYLRIDPSVYLYPLLQKWPFDTKSAETLLVRKEGKYVIYLNDLKFSNNAALNKKISLSNKEVPAVQAVMGRIGYFEGIDYRGIPVVTELRAIPNSSWYMVARMDKIELFEKLYNKITQLIFYLLIIAVLLAVIFLRIHIIQLRNFNKEMFLIDQRKKEYESNIHLANEKANLYLSLVGSIIVVIEKNGNVSMINDAGCKLLGYSREEIIGKNWFDTFLPQHEISKVKETFVKIAKGEVENVEYFENQILTKTGEMIDIAWHNNLLPNLGSDIIGTISSGEDITDRKRAHETIIKMNEELEEKVKARTQELLNSNSELETFAYSVAHDLRAPLRSIDGYSHMLMDEYGSRLDDEALRLLNIIRNSTHNMDQLIFDLLTMSKVARSEMNIEQIDMERLVNSVFYDLVSRKDQDRITFIVDRLSACYGDLSLIRQIWTNLIGNAVKYSSKRMDQKIHIQCDIDSENIIYSITDNGVGFNPLYQKKLFGAFQRLHTNEEFEGTGIGLAIVERIIRRHNGHVWADGVEGVGATFYFSLPIK